MSENVINMADCYMYKVAAAGKYWAVDIELPQWYAYVLSPSKLVQPWSYHAADFAHKIVQFWYYVDHIRLFV